MQTDLQSEFAPGTEAIGLHRRAVVVDGAMTSPPTAEQAERMRRGGVTAANYTRVFYNLRDGLTEIVRIRQQVEGQAETYCIATSAEEIAAAQASGKIAYILGLQNASPIEDRLEYVRVFHALGVRIIQLTYNERNLIGDGCVEPADAGLSRFGRQVVREMNRIGMLIDLSHCGYRTTREAIDHSEKPVAITHANPLRVSPNPRNKPDDILRALAERGGVVGVCTWSPFCHRNKEGRPRLNDLLDIIDYTVDLVGIDCVGVGTDHGEGARPPEEWEKLWGRRGGRYPEVTGGLGEWFGFETRYVEGFSSAAHWPNLTAGLVNRGYSEGDILKILGGNFLRLFRQVWI